MDETEDSDLKIPFLIFIKDIQANIWICTPNGLYLCDKNENPNFYTIKYSKINKIHFPAMSYRLFLRQT